MKEFTVTFSVHTSDDVTAGRVAEFIGELVEGESTARDVGRLMDEYLGRDGRVGVPASVREA